MVPYYTRKGSYVTTNNIYLHSQYKGEIKSQRFMTNGNNSSVTIPECTFWQLRGGGASERKVNPDYFVLFTKMSDVFSVKGDASGWWSWISHGRKWIRQRI